jgi:hypothetical protein
VHFARHAEGLRIDELIDKPPALDGPIFVEHHGGHVLHVVVERVTEGDHLDERREQHEEQRHRIAQHDNELLVENGTEAAEGHSHDSVT